MNTLLLVLSDDHVQESRASFEKENSIIITYTTALANYIFFFIHDHAVSSITNLLHRHCRHRSLDRTSPSLRRKFVQP
jgi:hypothetical protein